MRLFRLHFLLLRRGMIEWLVGHLVTSQGQPATVREDPQDWASAKPDVDTTQPALSTWGSHVQLMSKAFPFLQHLITGHVRSLLLLGALLSYQSSTNWLLNNHY